VEIKQAMPGKVTHIEGISGVSEKDFPALYNVFFTGPANLYTRVQPLTLANAMQQ
jgi:hypothetical protein